MTDHQMSDQADDSNDLIHPIIDLAVSLVLAAGALFCLFWLFPRYIVASVGENDVGPEFFPNFSAWIVIFLSVLLAFKSINALRSTEIISRRGYILHEIVIWAIISISVILGIRYLGFLITAPWIIILGAIACRYRTWWLILVLAVIVPLVIYQAAWLVFGVELP